MNYEWIRENVQTPAEEKSFCHLLVRRSKCNLYAFEINSNLSNKSVKLVIS